MGQFRKGAEAAAEASKSGGGNWAKVEYFGIEDGKSAVVRFLTDADEWIVVDQHQMIPTKGKPADFEGNWPQKMGSVCRLTAMADGSTLHNDCYICEHLVDGKQIKKPGSRTWALACLREEVIEDGKVQGYRDKIREVQRKKKDSDETETVTEKAIVVVNMGFKNFFSALQGFAGHYGTVLDRDYVIKRSGTGTDTDYNIIPLDPIVMDDKGTKFDLRDPEFAKRYESDLDLEKLVMDKASDEFYARFFDPRVTVSDKGGVSETGAGPEVAKPDNDVSPDRMKALADRVKGYSGDDESNNTSSSEGDSEPVAASSGGGMRDFG